MHGTEVSPALRSFPPCKDQGIVDALDQNGYAGFSLELDQTRLDELRSRVRDLLDGPAAGFDVFRTYIDKHIYKGQLFRDPSSDEVFLDFIGVSPAIDDLVDEILSEPQVQHVLREAFGSDCRVATCQARRARPEGKGLHLHQDRVEELSLTVLLSDTPEQEGATCFVPGSHRWPPVLGSFPFLAPGKIRSRLAAAKGVPGDAYFFLASTWHGRQAAIRPKMAIFISFRPQRFASEHRQPTSEAIAKLKPTLQHLFRAPDERTEQQQIGRSLDLWRRSKVSIFSPWRAVMFGSMIFKTAHQSLRYMRRMRSHFSHGHTAG